MLYVIDEVFTLMAPPLRLRRHIIYAQLELLDACHERDGCQRRAPYAMSAMKMPLS